MVTTRKTPAKKKPPAKNLTGKKSAAPIREAATQANEGEVLPITPEMKPLTEREEIFVSEYLTDLNATQAYMRSFTACKKHSTAAVLASTLLRKPNIRVKIDAERMARIKRLQIDTDQLIGEVVAIATADPRELVENIVGCCRYCWGTDFQMLRTPAELERDRRKHEQQQDALQKSKKNHERVPFEVAGGTGYDSARDPNPECPECSGKGVSRVVIKDTRTLSESGRALYAGLKEGKDGIEVKMHSKLDAIDKLWRHLGLYEADNGQKVPVLADVSQLDELYARKMAERAENSKKVEGRSARITKEATSK